MIKIRIHHNQEHTYHWVHHTQNQHELFLATSQESLYWAYIQIIDHHDSIFIQLLLHTSNQHNMAIDQNIELQENVKTLSTQFKQKKTIETNLQSSQHQPNTTEIKEGSDHHQKIQTIKTIVRWSLWKIYRKLQSIQQPYEFQITNNENNEFDELCFEQLNEQTGKKLLVLIYMKHENNYIITHMCACVYVSMSVCESFSFFLHELSTG